MSHTSQSTRRPRTNECYDCHLQVEDLRSHRAVCRDRGSYRPIKEAELFVTFTLTFLQK